MNKCLKTVSHPNSCQNHCPYLHFPHHLMSPQPGYRMHHWTSGTILFFFFLGKLSFIKSLILIVFDALLRYESENIFHLCHLQQIYFISTMILLGEHKPSFAFFCFCFSAPSVFVFVSFFQIHPKICFQISLPGLSLRG